MFFVQHLTDFYGIVFLLSHHLTSFRGAYIQWRRCLRLRQAITLLLLSRMLRIFAFIMEGILMHKQ